MLMEKEAKNKEGKKDITPSPDNLSLGKTKNKNKFYFYLKVLG